MRYKAEDRDQFANLMLLTQAENGAGGKCDILPEECFKGKSDEYLDMHLIPNAFRVVVTEAYHRSCSITGEKTLPVLDAAHIKPFSENGPNISQNGILLRYSKAIIPGYGRKGMRWHTI